MFPAETGRGSAEEEEARFCCAGRAGSGRERSQQLAGADAQINTRNSKSADFSTASGKSNSLVRVVH